MAGAGGREGSGGGLAEEEQEDEWIEERIVFYKYHRQGKGCVGAGVGKGRSGIETCRDLTRLLLWREQLRALCGCQVVQSCQNQTAFLLQKEEEVVFLQCFFFFSKINHFKSLFKQTEEISTFFFLKSEEQKKKSKRSAFYFPIPSSCGRHLEWRPLRQYLRIFLIASLFSFYVSMPYWALSFLSLLLLPETIQRGVCYKAR